MEERRRAGGRLLKNRRWSKSRIARYLGVSRAAVSQWAKRIRSGGLRRLRQRQSHGRPAKLSPQQKRLVLRLLKRGAQAAGFPTARWTLPRIQKLIERELGIVYHPNYLNRWLRQLDWSPQYPLPQAIERDEDLIEAWLQHDWPRLKKGAANRRRNRVFR
jgi:transposase